MGVESVTWQHYDAFVGEKEFAVVHFDAEWDVGGRPLTRMVIAATAKEFPTGVNFGEVDCGADGKLAKSIPVLNVPLVAYYRRGQLVAALIGSEQNILERLRRVMRDESIGYKDGSEAAPSVQIDAEEIRAELLKARDAYHDKWRNSEFGRGDTGAR